MNIYNAKNVFLGLQQSETAYWQVSGDNTGVINPAPWTNSLLPSEPDFSWCAASDTAVRMECSSTV
jgi:glucan 1,3-beta-glucosidase